MSAGSINARDIHGIRVAHFKDTILSIVGHVVCHTNAIESVLAITAGIRSSGVANLKCGNVTTDEPESTMNIRHRKINEETNMFQSWICSIVVPSVLNAVEYIRPPIGFPFFETNDQMTTLQCSLDTTHQILPMGIKFTSIVSWVDVNVRLIDKANVLNVVRIIEDLKACESARRNYPGAMARLGTPCDFLALRVRDRGVWRRWSEDTKVWAIH